MDFVFAIAMLIVSAVISSVIARSAKKSSGVTPAGQDEFDFPQVDEGTPQAVIFGDCWTSSWMVLWYGDYKIEPIKSKGGKK